jgi:hypothetical protein
MERGEGEHVHANVVVLVRAPRLVALALLVLGERYVTRWPVGPVGLGPQRPFPVAGLPQQVVPRDLAVVLRVEVVRGDVALHRIVEVADHAPIPR